MAGSEGFLDPDLSRLFGDAVANIYRKIRLYEQVMVLLFAITIIISIIMIGLILHVNGLHWVVEGLGGLLVIVTITALLIMFYSFVWLVLYLYRTIRELELEPSQSSSERLQYKDAECGHEIYGVQRSNARSVFYAGFAFLFAVLWWGVIEVFLALGTLFSLSQTIDKIDVNQLKDPLVSVANIITGANIESALQTLNIGEVILVIQTLPPLLTGYIAFRHTMFLLEKSMIHDNPDAALKTELPGLVGYYRQLFTKAMQEGNILTFLRFLWVSLTVVLITYWFLFLGLVILQSM